MNWNPAPWQITALILLVIYWGASVLHLLRRIVNLLDEINTRQDEHDPARKAAQADARAWSTKENDV